MKEALSGDDSKELIVRAANGLEVLQSINESTNPSVNQSIVVSMQQQHRTTLESDILACNSAN